jgi:glycosyltransferase involved in cell wall biosynthesis
MKKIVFINSTMNLGGVPRVISLWSNYLVKKGFSVEVVSNINKEYFYEFDKKINHTILGIDQFGRGNKLLILFKLYSLLKNRKDEYLIFNKSHYTGYLYILKLFNLYHNSLKVIYFVHGGTSDFKTLYNNQKKYLIYKTYDSIIALHNDYDSHKFKYPTSWKRKILDFIISDRWKQIEKKIFILSNPLTFETEEIADYSTKTILAIGRLDKNKGFDLLIDSWLLIKDKYPEWNLKIVGSGEEEINLRKKANGITSIQLLPANYDVKNIYLSSSIYAMSSLEEGLGMVLLEAMQSGLPIVGFSNVGSRFLVKNGHNGFLCDVGDIESLAINLSNLMSDLHLIKKMGKNSKQSSEEFKIDYLYSKFLSVLKNTNNEKENY